MTAPASVNPKDPLLAASTDNGFAIFQAMMAVSKGAAIDDVISAAMNIVVNGLRMSYADRKNAHERLNFWAARFHQILDDHYDNSGSRKNGIFPFHQKIILPTVVDSIGTRN